MKNLKERILLIAAIIVLFSAGFISGCSTMRGLASDIGDGARAVEKGLEPWEQSRQSATR